MRFEDLKCDFPKMPEEIRVIIEKEVEKQVKTEHAQLSNRKRAVGKVLAASAAAVMLLGTTAFAGVSMFRMQRQQISEHGVKVKTSGTTQSDQTGAEPVKSAEVQNKNQDKNQNKIQNVKMEIGYLPDGMVQTEEGKYSYQDALYQGGISIGFYRMDTGDGQFEMLHEDVLSSEDISGNGFDGVYLEYPHLYKEEITFNQRIYAAFADVHYVMEMYVASDVSKEDAIRIAKSIQLTPTDEAGAKNLISALNWSAYLENGREKQQEDGEYAQNTDRTEASKEEMQHTHAIGENFEVQDHLTAKVAQVQVSDDLSLLNGFPEDEDFKDETDSSGKLKPATIQYIKGGGLDTLSEVIKERQVPQKLVYATVDYTNTGDKELKEVLFFGTLQRISEEDGKMKMVSGWNYEESSDGDAWNQVCNRGLSNRFEMPYYDVHGGERNNNYITSIKPGETVTVHMGWIVTEEELDKLYLSLDTYSGPGVFSDTALAIGYVDIRQ